MIKTRTHKPSILFIGTTDNSGGAARVGWELGHELMRRGFNVKYVVGYKKSDKSYVHELSKPAILKWLDNNTRYNITALLRHIRSYILANNIDFGASDEILNHPWYKEADIVHCQNLHGNYFKLEVLEKISSEKKLVWTLHDMSAITGKCAYTENPTKWEEGYHSCNALNSYPPMLWDNTSYLWSKKKTIYQKMKIIDIVTPSKWLEKIVKRSILNKHRIKTVYNGVDTDKFKPRNKKTLRNKLNLPTDKRIVLFVAQGGKNDPRKGGKYFEEVANELTNNDEVLFLCVGGKPSEVKMSTNTVKYIPFTQDASYLASIFAASDIFLFTSLAENCPLVVLEALSSGLPVVSFNVGGVKELVKHKENGFIARLGSKKDILTGLNCILGMKDSEIRKISVNNRKKALDQYTITKMADNYQEVYSK